MTTTSINYAKTYTITAETASDLVEALTSQIIRRLEEHDRLSKLRQECDDLRKTVTKLRGRMHRDLKCEMLAVEVAGMPEAERRALLTGPDWQRALSVDERITIRGFMTRVEKGQPLHES